MSRPAIVRRTAALLLGLALVSTACSSGSDTLTVYSGRTENLIGPLLADFTEQTGVEVEVRYGNSADLALLISEEGDRTPADVFISQSPGAIGFLGEAGLLGTIDENVLELVDPSFRSSSGSWVGLSGRVRVLVYNEDLIDGPLPESVFELTSPDYEGRVGLAPANGSFQDFVTAMREVHGDDVTLAWLEGMEANDAQTYTNNTAIVQAVGRGEVPMGLVNHYYNFRAQLEDPAIASENHYFADGDIGSLLIATAAGVLDGSEAQAEADQLLAFLLGETAQTFFSEETLEYPLAAGVAASAALPPLDTLNAATYDFDRLGGGLERTRELIDASGLEAP
ncbi:MAG: iron ABC transporter substrate-binding protein [Acidimicrobiia bacterium]|nr:iron ABC transporter substrate-binding protein [Acidimicrobiia bacterium]MBT8217276.1 iron ABC transporter substrate-binding protein [Acidimicrobiia bacterium]NNF08654.1 iron ABC transporter substrate-binding protein [Acidimicrobiia bacterium]NNL70646.1 iron ABC transporter substrate-binding protein [Acidimicrobiia bacterium]